MINIKYDLFFNKKQHLGLPKKVKNIYNCEVEEKVLRDVCNEL